ncbi:MAG: HD-GYP domain-containing protein [Acidaminococcaceae bacterium]
MNEEFALIKTHSKAGYEIIKNIDFPYPVADILLQHHERLDGSGYPKGLRDTEILLGAKIVAVADVVEAISAHRPYRPALGIDKALETIESMKGIQFDKDVVETCLSLFREDGFKFS